VLLALVVLELARGHRPNELQFAVMLVAVAFVLSTNIPKLVDGVHDPRTRSAIARAELGAVELAKGVVDPHFNLEKYAPGAQTPIQAAWYLAAVERWGSPADTPAGIARRPESTREVVDNVLADAMRLAVTPAATTSSAGRGRPPAVAPGAHRTDRSGACVRLQPRRSPGSYDLTLHAPAVLVSATGGKADLALRRFAERFTVPLGPAQAGSTVRIAFPPDSALLPWHLRIVAPGSVTACSAT
jgi:hypothetical protein